MESTLTAAPAATSPEVARLIAWLHRYANTRINFRLMDERRTVPPHVVLEFGNQGILGLQVPRQYGGLGLSDRDAMRVYEYLGTVNLTLAAWVGQNNSLGVRPIVDSANEQLKDTWLPGLATGRILASYALTEPHAGSFPNNIRGSFVADGPGRYRFNATKIYIGNAGWSTVVNVFGKLLNGDAQAAGFTGAVVRTDAPGVVLGAEHLTLGLRAAVQNQIDFRNVLVTEDELLAPAGESHRVSHSAMQMSRMVLGAVSIGALKRCLKLMHTYAKRRDIATGKLLDNPHTLAVMNEVVAQYTAVELLLALLTQRLEEQQPLPDELFMIIKVMATEFLSSASDKLIQVLGGRGYTENNVAAALYRDARVFRIFEGPSEALFYFVGFLYRQRTLPRFLERQLGAETLVATLNACAEQLTAQSQALPGSSEYRSHLVNGRLGELAAWATLLAVVRAAGPHPHAALAQGWLEARFRQVSQQVLDFGALRPAYSGQHLTDLLETLPELDLAQGLPDELTELDDYLKR